MMVDHRNYDYILKSGNVPKKNIYYNVSRTTPLACINDAASSYE